jgi:hypothetical protein
MSVRAVRSTVAVLFAVVLVAPAGRTSVRAAQGPQKSAFVTVIADASGPIKDLTAKDFVAYEDSAKRDVLGAELSGDPLSIVLMVDVSQPPPSTMPATQDLRTSLAKFIKTIRLSGGDADITLCQVSNAPVFNVDFGKLVELDSAVSRIVPDQSTTAVVLEGLADAGKKLVAKPAPRRAIVSIDFNSQEGSAEKAMKPAVQSIHESGATVWAVSVRGSSNSPLGTAAASSALIANNANRETVLNDVTKANGGMRFQVKDSSGLEGAMKAIANSLSSQYVVTFSHPGGNPKVTRFETSRGAKVLVSPFMR